MTRNRSYDIAKGFAICLMVLGHSYSVDNPVLWFINAFHMPFFFMISGMLYADKFQNGVTFHVGKMAQKLLIPYVVFEVAFCAYLGLFSTDRAFLDVFFEKIKWTFTLEGNNATWFLACMFVTEVLFFAVLKYVKKPAVCLVIFAVLALIGNFAPLTFLPKVLQRAMVYIGYMAVGYYGKTLLAAKQPLLVWLSAAAGFAATVLTKNYVDISLVTSVVTILAAVLGSFVLIQLSMRVQHVRAMKAVEYFGLDTLIVLCTHIFVIEALRLIDYKVLGDFFPKLGIFEGFALTAIVLLTMCVIIPLCNRYFWFLFGKKRKKAS